MSYQVLLFQPYLRKHILNFGKLLKRGQFVYPTAKSKYSYAMLPTFEKEVERRKDQSWQVRLRRLFGIPNIRLKLTQSGDVLFTYGCLLLTNKPYATYLETGVALYNYDVQLSRHPVARLLVSWLITRSNCRQLVFMSEASKKSFFATVPYSPNVARIARAKSVVIYPLVEVAEVEPKQSSVPLRLLFTGLFYMKGGMEVAHAFEQLRAEKQPVELTIVTPLHMLRAEDLRYLQTLPGVQLIDAKLSGEEMDALYATHHVFVLPTYRDGFCLVVIEALAHGLPVITTDQYAIAEMVTDGVNGFVYPTHPLKDYDPVTFQLLGKYRNPKDFYRDLFRLQATGSLRPIEAFVRQAVRQYVERPQLLEEHSKHALVTYRERFGAEKISREIESVFVAAVDRSVA